MKLKISNKILSFFSEQQKRRRFHPLKNLRRIFRRRTITNGDSGNRLSQSSSATTSPSPTIRDQHLPHETLSSPTSPLPSTVPGHHNHHNHYHHHNMATSSVASTHRVMMSSSSTTMTSSSSASSTITTSNSTSAVNSNRISVRTIKDSGFNTSTPISSYHQQLREKLTSGKKEVKEERRSMGDTDTEAISDSQRSLSEGRLIDR